MASILDLFKTSIGKILIKKSEEVTGEQENKISTILSMLLPLTLGKFKNDIIEDHRDSLNEMLIQAPVPREFLQSLHEKSSKEIIACGKEYEEFILGKNFDKISETIVNATETSLENVEKITDLAIPVLVAILSIAKTRNNIPKYELEILLDSALGISSKYSNSLNSIIFSHNTDPNIIKDPSEIVVTQQKYTSKKESILKGFTSGK
ncbi:hypothetical protein [Zunongwangia sp.]|uniref:hypothetical protein n=1 Tax=Zunongwangia sp. TaxID=1965325 RepID=UPI003AA84CD9